MSPTTKPRAIFLDRDGVINETVDRGDNFFVLEKKVRHTAPYSYAEFKFFPGVTEALHDFKARGYLLILASNQPDITYGTLPATEHEKIMAEINKLPLDDIYLCTHGRHDNCVCKKPKPGMLLTAAEKWGIDLANSIMVGDTKADLETALGAGTKFILIENDHNHTVEAELRAPHLSAITPWL